MFKTKSQVVYDYLRESLMGGGIKLGEKITTRIAAEKLDASEIPVGEADKMLESQDFVEVTPSVGDPGAKDRSVSLAVPRQQL